MKERCAQFVWVTWDFAREITSWPDFHCRSMASSPIRRTSKSNLRASSSLIRRTSSITSSTSGFEEIVFIGKKFLWSTDNWKLDAVARKASSKSVANVRIRNVFAVPSQEKGDLMDARDRQMKRVSGRDGGHDVSLDEFVRQIVDICVDSEESNPREEIYSRLGHFSFARCDFVQHHLTRAEVITCPMGIPPATSADLTGRLQRVPGRPGHVITWNGAFNEHRVRHPAMVSQTSVCKPA